jgi:thiosulfate reductase cytochrome b subunit
MALRKVMVFRRFERFWHWSQAALIFGLLFSGLAVHGLHRLVSFEQAVQLHVVLAVALIVLWLFAVFWHMTTGAWRHYLPTRQGLGQVAYYYLIGIFKGEHHPYRKAYWRKHNPLQALSYAGLKLGLFPAIWISGLAYLGYGLWAHFAGATQWLAWVAMLHTASAYLILAFIIIHLYLLTTGHSFAEHVRPMLTGFDDVELSPEEIAYLERDEPGQIRPQVGPQTGP